MWAPASCRAPSNLATPSSCGDDLPNQSSTAFAHDLVDDLIPFFQSRYRTSKSPDDRAIGGLSMGACQTAAIAFTHSDVFHSIILMSPGALTNVDRVFPTFFEDAARLNKKMKLVWIASGRDDPRTETGAKTLDTALSAHGVTHISRYRWSARVGRLASSPARRRTPLVSLVWRFLE